MSPEAKPPILNQTSIAENLPIPPDQEMPVSSPQALKKRLDWGEPGFTVLDARDKESFLEEHITGAMLLDFVGDSLSSMSRRRDIYVYGDGEEEASQAAEKLRNAGFNRVSRIEGGLARWKAISGPTEGRLA